MSLLVSFLYLLLHIAVIVIVALAIRWICRACGYPLDAQVEKVGGIIVLLLILIAVVLWLMGIDLPRLRFG